MKKVLIVSHNALSLHANNGKTLNSLFASYPSEDICQLYFQEEIPESQQFSQFFRITDLDILCAIIKFWKRKDVGCELAAKNKVVFHYSGSGKLKYLIVRILRRSYAFKLLLRNVIYGTGLWKSTGLTLWLSKCSPDSVFFVGGNSLFSFKIAREIADELNIPLDVFITDDYVLNVNVKGIVSFILMSKLKKEYIDICKSARNFFVIGEQMGAAFKGLYERKYIPIMNSVHIPKELPEIKIIDEDDNISIVYAGGLHLGRDLAILQFSYLLKRLTEKYGYKFDFKVYSFQSPSKIMMRRYMKNRVNICSAVDADQLYKILSSSHYVLHVESFYERYTRQTKLSVSTKIPEYLISGSCVIAFCPNDLASYKIINDNNIGICIDAIKPRTSIIENFVNSIKSNDLRAKYISDGYNYAKEKFSIEKNQNYLYNLIN